MTIAAAGESGETEPQPVSWRLTRSLVRNTETGREDEVVALEPSSLDYEVSTVSVTLDAKPSLGIELVEVEGSNTITTEGRVLRRALVLVSGLVEAGNAWARAQDPDAVRDKGSVLLGDTIVAVGDGRGTVAEVEALPYDDTVAAISQVALDSDEVVLVVKRLVRRKVARVTVLLPGGDEEVVKVYHGENLRMGLLRQGLSVNDGEANRYDSGGGKGGNCGGQGICATCVVSVLNGGEFLTERTVSEKQLLRKVVRWRQSCKAKINIKNLDPSVHQVEMKVQVAPRSSQLGQ